MSNNHERNSSAKLFVLSAPSGSGKTTIARAILEKHTDFIFSVSATTRKHRPQEFDGKDYYFLTKVEFKRRISNNEFIEYEYIYGEYYGTLKNQIEDALKNGTSVVFDVDVKGALSIKRVFPEDAILIFVVPPDLNTLVQRLRGRKTESEERIQRRLNRVPMEMNSQRDFDYVIINSDLNQAIAEVEKIIRVQLQTNKTIPNVNTTNRNN